MFEFFQVNGTDNAVVKIPRRDIEKLDKTEAIDIALKQEEVQKNLFEKTIHKSLYTMYPGYECVVNILATKVLRKAVEMQHSVNVSI